MSLVNCLSDPVRSCSRFAVLIFMLSFVDRFLLMTISPSGRAFPTALEDSIIQTVMTVLHDTVRVRHPLWNLALTEFCFLLQVFLWPPSTSHSDQWNPFHPPCWQVVCQCSSGCINTDSDDKRVMGQEIINRREYECEMCESKHCGAEIKSGRRSSTLIP